MLEEKKQIAKFIQKAQCYKTFYVRILQIFGIRVFIPDKPFKYSLCFGVKQEPTQETLRSGRLWPYLQTLDNARKACQGQALYLTKNLRKLRP
jgi:hypothetical protein